MDSNAMNQSLSVSFISSLLGCQATNLKIVQWSLYHLNNRKKINWKKMNRASWTYIKTQHL